MRSGTRREPSVLVIHVLCRVAVSDRPSAASSFIFFVQGTPGLPGPVGDKGVRGDKGDRGLTTTLKGDQFPTGIIEGPPGPPGPPGNVQGFFLQSVSTGRCYYYFIVVALRVDLCSVLSVDCADLHPFEHSLERFFSPGVGVRSNGVRVNSAVSDSPPSSFSTTVFHRGQQLIDGARQLCDNDDDDNDNNNNNVRFE